MLQALGDELPDFEIPQSPLDRWRGELIKIAKPERIWQLAAEYEGDAGEKPLKSARFCKWALGQVKAGQHENDEGPGLAEAVSPTR